MMTQRFRVVLIVGIALLGLMPTVADANIAIQFDYTLDSNGFFGADTEARQTLEWVGKYYSSLLNDDFLEIDSSGVPNYTAAFFRPDTDSQGLVSNFGVVADTITIYVGGHPMTGDLANALAWSSPGWDYSLYGSTSWKNDVISRGQGDGLISDVEGSGADEVAIWGGSLSVNMNFIWNKDHAMLPESTEHDLTSVLLHEFCHILGFGSVDSWDNLVSGTTFIGAEATAANLVGGVPTPPSLYGTAHWSMSTPNSMVFGTDMPQSAIMKPYTAPGVKIWDTALDIAALDDIGWALNPIDDWQGTSGGVFSNPSNWSTGVSPGSRDSVRFNTASSLTVSFTQDAQMLQVSCESGPITWALNGHTAQVDMLWATASSTDFVIEGGTLQLAVMATMSPVSSVAVQNAGRLELLDSTFKGTLDVNSGGELIGNGVIVTDLNHNAGGIVSPGGDGAAGSFVIEDDYFQAVGATLQIDLLSVTDYDTIDVGDILSLEGDLMISLGPGFLFNENDTYTILAGGSLTGEFDSITSGLVEDNLYLDTVYDYTAGTVSLVVTAAIAGDANYDGKIDSSDLAILADNWMFGVGGLGGATWGMGDFNLDGQVDSSDLGLLANYWQNGVGMGMFAVPEPSTAMLLLCLAGVGLFSLRRNV